MADTSEHRLNWAAVLKDQKVFYQRDPHKDEALATYEDIPQEGLDQFQLWLRIEDKPYGLPVFAIQFDEGQRLIWRRRVEFKPGTGIESVVHIVGKRSAEGKTLFVALVFEADSKVLILDNFDENHGLAYPPELLEQER